MAEKSGNDASKNVDIEKQEISKSNETNNNEGLEKPKPVKIPGINAAEVVFYGVFGSMFVIGWIHFNNCPLNRMIPIYLIVAGFAGIAMKALSTTYNKHLFNVFLAVVLFYFVWTVLGSYWVYKEYQPSYYDYSSERYCNRTAYLIAFWILSMQYTVLCLFMTLSGCYFLMRGDFRR